MAQAKLRDARLLLDHGRYGNAYYLAGYAVEIALKVCAARLFMQDVIPDKKFVTDIYQHNLKNLVNVAGLARQLKEREKDPAFAANWAFVGKWYVDARYLSVDRTSAQVQIDAVGNEQDGVFPWIKHHW